MKSSLLLASPARRNIAAGVLLTATYVLVASWTLGPSRPLRPFFDGSSPPVAYRWVVPPPELADTNQPPENATKTFKFERKEVVEGGTKLIMEGGLITTPDAQVSMSVPAESFKPTPGATGITIKVTQIDPTTVGEPPEGVAYEGNAARVIATYVPSGEPAVLADLDCTLGGCLSMVVRYPVAGTQLWVRDGTAWKDLVAENSAASSSMFSPTKKLGDFAVTSIPAHKPSSSNLSQILAFVLGGVAVVAAVVLQRVRTRGNKSPTRGRSGQASSARGRSGQGIKPQGKSATKGRPRR